MRWLLSVVFVLSPCLALALTREELVFEIKRLLDTNDTEFIQLLEEEGITLNYSSIGGSYGTGTLKPSKRLSNPIDSINEASRQLTSDRWRDIVEALRDMSYTTNETEEPRIRHISSTQCQKHYSKVRDDIPFAQCQFRVAATKFQFDKDNEQCSRDIDALYEDKDLSEKERLRYGCMRNGGWDNPNNWLDNVKF